MKGQMTFADDSPEYQEFVERHKPKKTTDECYTPEAVYEAVAGWVEKEYGVPRGSMVRPFYPGGDYENNEYPDGCAVVDNPPFSIFTKIVRFYEREGVRYFLFGPALTLMNAPARTYLCCGAKITYENGANVNTSFVTNLDERYCIRTAPDLRQAVEAANKKPEQSRGKHVVAAFREYEYPPDVVTAARLPRLSKHGVPFDVEHGRCVHIKQLDAQLPYGVKLYGGGFLLGAAEAAEAAEAAKTVWALSERERKMQQMIDQTR